MQRRYGCVPVAATDFLYEAFEPEIDWGYFGVKGGFDFPQFYGRFGIDQPKKPTAVRPFFKRHRCSGVAEIVESSFEGWCIHSMHAHTQARNHVPS